MEMVLLRVFLFTFLLGIIFGLVLVKILFRPKYIVRLKGKDPYAFAAMAAVAYFIILVGVLLFCNSINAGLGYLAGVCVSSLSGIRSISRV